MGRIRKISQRALRDYAFKVLKSEYGERVENGVVIPARYSDRELAEFVGLMPDWQIEQMYKIIYCSEMEVT